MLTDRRFGEHDYTPGRELFRTDRRVRIWAQTVSHRQLLLRAIDNVQPTRIDLLFKDVDEQCLRSSYNGLIVRVATEAESVGTCFVLESGDVRDHVHAGSFSWQEEEQTDVGPRSLISMMTPDRFGYPSLQPDPTQTEAEDAIRTEIAAVPVRG